MELKQMYQMHGNFNPLPRKEGDIALPFTLKIMSLFQSAPS